MATFNRACGTLVNLLRLQGNHASFRLIAVACEVSCLGHLKGKETSMTQAPPNPQQEYALGLTKNGLIV
ncbi:MAG: hypothetical protein NTU53_01265, partial [Planctomycetota bacterium]|nr:hypothetical protein [Planctomycetota bacterium]